MVISLTQSSECCFFFNDAATTEIYALSLHDALPICSKIGTPPVAHTRARAWPGSGPEPFAGWGTPISVIVCPPFSSVDRKSTRLNSSHANISYAVFCLKKKKGPRTGHDSVRCAGPIH